MLEDLKQAVLEANIALVKHGLVLFTWGNVSGLDMDRGLVVIKPSGVDYNKLVAEDMVVVDLERGKVVEGHYRPSSDTPTHLELYRSFTSIRGIAHTHSMNATAFAQAHETIKVLGTTHADYFFGDILCTRSLSEIEVMDQYELNTGRVIVETMQNIDPLARPGILVGGHGPFCWGVSPDSAVFHSAILEYLAKMNRLTLEINKKAAFENYILKKHYLRKHGADAYYGQNN